MKYKVEVTIDLPRERVIELFASPDNMHKWQPGLKSFENMEGEPGQAGTKSRLKYDMNGRIIDMVETITVRNLPAEFSGTYEARNVWNLVENRFYETEDGRTRWVSENEFRMGGFMKLMAIFMKGAFPRESLKQMNSFKEFAETEGPDTSSLIPETHQGETTSDQQEQ
jgi:hypothetical protein